MLISLLGGYPVWQVRIVETYLVQLPSPRVGGSDNILIVTLCSMREK